MKRACKKLNPNGDDQMISISPLKVNVVRMKKISLILMIVIFVLSSGKAQQGNDEKSENDTTGLPGVIIRDDPHEVTVEMPPVINEIYPDTFRIRIGQRNINVAEDEEGTTSVRIVNEDKKERRTAKFKGHWSGFGIGLNNFTDENFSVSRTGDNQFMDLQTGRSWKVDLNLGQASFGILGSGFGLVTGFGFSFNNYFFDNPNTIHKVDGVTVSRDITMLNPVKSKLTVSYLQVPLLLEWQIGEKKKRSDRLYIAAGVIGKLKLGSHTKVVYTENNRKRKEKERDDFNINPLRYCLTVRAGYKSMGINAAYSPVLFFEKGKGPELNPLSVGLSLTL